MRDRTYESSSNGGHVRARRHDIEISGDSTFIVVSSPFGPIALTLNQLRSARALANELIVADNDLHEDRDASKRPESPTLVDAREIARLIGIKPSWLLQRAREGRIPHYRIGKYIRFDPAEIRATTHKKPDRQANSEDTPLT